MMGWMLQPTCDMRVNLSPIESVVSLKMPTSIVSSPWSSSAGEGRILSSYQQLAFLRGDYPGFREWFFGKVAPGLVSGERQLIGEFDGDTPVGLVIAKRTPVERKLCTVWVERSCRGHGLAYDLMRAAMCWLDEDYPVITANEKVVEDLRPTLKRLKFVETDRRHHLYRWSNVEHIFNGRTSAYWLN